MCVIEVSMVSNSKVMEQKLKKLITQTMMLAAMTVMK